MILERCLYIVPTPIGNLSDMTARALDVLADVDVIAAEDTRHSQKLLSHYDINTPTRAYHEHAGDAVTDALVQIVVGGGSVALISDAGTPLVSDPGYRLVRAVQDAGGRVVPLPGPCAAIAALSASGLPTDRFWFEGFLPAKATQRKHRLETLVGYPGTLVFYEAPHRISASLNDAAAVLGATREAVLARELTKTYETLRRLPLGAMAQWVAEDPNQQRGELVFMVASSRDDGRDADVPIAASRLLQRLAQELPPRKAAAIVAEAYGLKARALYDLLLGREQS